MAALKFKNVTAPRRVKQKSSVIAHFDRRKNVFGVKLSFFNFFIARWRLCQKTLKNQISNRLLDSDEKNLNLNV